MDWSTACREAEVRPFPPMGWSIDMSVFLSVTGGPDQ
jgi:hypothetical protein